MSGKAEGDGPTVKKEAEVMNKTAKNTGYILAYGHQVEETLQWPKGLSALMVNEAGEVFGTGINSLVGGDYPDSFPMKAGGGAVLQSYVKVEAFSGWQVKKIVVGPGFGAALSSSDEVLIWVAGFDLGADDFVSFKDNQSDMECATCSRRCYSYLFGGFNLAYCCDCCEHLQASHHDRNAKTFVRCRKVRTLTCPTCTWPSSLRYKLDNIEFHSCAHCKKFLEKESSLQSQNTNTIMKLVRTNNEIVRDIACTNSLICLLLECNKLVLRNYDTGHEHTQPLKTSGTAENENSVKMVSLYGGGESCFVETEDGNLFECPTYWDDKSPFKLMKINLPAAVEKVCCGSTAAAALLVDGSVWFITSGKVKTYPLYGSAGVSASADIAAVAITDAFLVQTSKGMKSGECQVPMKFAEGAGKILVQLSETGLPSAINKMISGLDDAQVLAPPIPNAAQLYGKTFLSDMTIQMSDGEFPAHSVVLFSTSAHFRETYTASRPPPKVLDVSEYNAKAYRCLLQYFYQLKPDDLDALDLVDLRQIATSYGETALAEAATFKIKSKLDEDNVLKIFARAKTFGFQDLMTACRPIMLSPTFHERLLQDALKNSNFN